MAGDYVRNSAVDSESSKQSFSENHSFNESQRSGLKRLIESPLFDTWMALSYIWKYSGNEVGVQFALFEKLRQMPYKDVEFILPQLCHLMVCTDSESAVLESFLVDISQTSLHAAIFCLWYFEHFVSDYRTTFSKDAHFYLRAVKMLRTLQRSVFGSSVAASHPSMDDCKGAETTIKKSALMASNGSLESLSDGLRWESMDTKPFPHIAPCILGVGMSLAAAIIPKHGETIKPIVQVELRQTSFLHRAPAMSMADAYTGSCVRFSKPHLSILDNASEPHLTGAMLDEDDDAVFEREEGEMIDETKKNVFSLPQYLIKASKKISANTPAFMMLSGQPAATPSATPVVDHRSSMTANQKKRYVSSPPPIPLYYSAEMQFVMTLIDVSVRLVNVEKSQRVDALRQELSLINHNLPAPICLPLWCNGGGCVNGKHCNHHRILRICTSDAVVLNSAERVPYLIQVEVLSDDASCSVDFETILRMGNASSVLSSSCTATNSVTSHPTSASEFTNTDTLDTFVSPMLRPEGMETVLTLSSIDNLFSSASVIEPLDAMQSTMSVDSFTTRMRTAASMLACLTRQAAQPNCSPRRLRDIQNIKEGIMKEMEDLEKSRLIDALQSLNTGSSSSSSSSSSTVAREMDVVVLDSEQQLSLSIEERNRQEDPSALVFRELAKDKKERLRQASPFGHLPGWDLHAVIVKSGADMRQEQLACQILQEMIDIWKEENLDLWAYSFKVLVASNSGGLMEVVPNAISVHSIKKAAALSHSARQDKANVSDTTVAVDAGCSLRDHYIKTFGSPDCESFLEAQECFVQSLAAYSLITYILQIKDRHDGNILVDDQGHLIHIDFGFMLSNSPGYVGFESAPFKLTSEYVDLMGGMKSKCFDRFKQLFYDGFRQLRKHAERVIVLVEIMQRQSKLPCFYSGESAVTQLRQRFHLNIPDSQLKVAVDRLIISSAYSVFTKLYDTFQYYSNGIL